MGYLTKDKTELWVSRDRAFFEVEVESYIALVRESHQDFSRDFGHSEKSLDRWFEAVVGPLAKQLQKKEKDEKNSTRNVFSSFMGRWKK